MSWRMRIDLEDDSDDNSSRARSRWKTRLSVIGTVLLLSLWLLLITALAAWLAARV